MSSGNTSEQASEPKRGGDSSPDDMTRGDSRTLGSDGARDGDTQEQKKKDKKTTITDKMKKLWAKSMLDVPTLKIMAKGGLAPTIAIAA